MQSYITGVQADLLTLLKAGAKRILVSKGTLIHLCNAQVTKPVGTDFREGTMSPMKEM